jgi:hypothetical protein
MGQKREIRELSVSRILSNERHKLTNRARL